MASRVTDDNTVVSFFSSKNRGYLNNLITGNKLQTKMTINWNPLKLLRFFIQSSLGILMIELLGVESYSLINELELYTVLEAVSRYQNCQERHLERMRKMQEEASSSSGHGKNEGEETSTNVENPRRKGEDKECEEVRSMNEEHEFVKNFKNLEINPNGDDEPETVGTNEEDESMENMENCEESTMEDYWNPQRLHQFVIELESMASIMYLFRKQLEAIMKSEVEKSRVREIVSGYRAAYIPRFEKVKKMREEASGSSSNGRNEEQESTENAENCSKNRDVLGSRHLAYEH
ncbi:hypothetical protein L2E82_08741 [Cichorium intybus]|uniref:Uncharacterized protein n=1 Tax=Cichorium intybus TaxID=13427 RepID=A0ACB9G8T8_CICIN|nr:hypothetical protein L2E82_08741 [Cichorium intybus]